MNNSYKNDLTEIRQKVKQLLVSNLGQLEMLDPAEIKDDVALFGEGLGLDSLDALEIVVLLQKHFNIEIKDMNEGREVFATVDSLSRFIQMNASKDEN
ncbi:MAG: phosphopantetheine-binding protein [Candidatus Scalindua sp.]|nr:phosphopantetheine-binding protein [Candidatus Scalindua sp.]MCR4344669.1 phosphopantetheine-binding protein [Candidatus Scalindua sp.]